LAEEKIEYVNKEGKRLDGRKVDELREIKIKPSIFTRAEGSAMVEWGQNKAIAAVYGPREALPQHIQDPKQALVNFVYRMATFSVPDRKNPRPGRRDVEISKVSSEACARAIFLERYPNTTIDIYVQILDSNAGTRIAALTAASVALADAGIPMRDLVCGAAVGRAGGNIILDLNKEEEDAPDAVDMPLAILPNTDEIVLLQMDGLLTRKEFDEAIELGIKGCKQVHELQKKALKQMYEKGMAEQPKEAASAPSEMPAEEGGEHNEG